MNVDVAANLKKNNRHSASGRAPCGREQVSSR